MTKRDYFFENASFFDSAFKVFEMQEAYDSYRLYLQTHGMVPKTTLNFHPKLRDEVEEALQTGESLTFADLMFIVEEPPGVSPWPWPGAHPGLLSAGLGSRQGYVVPCRGLFQRRRAAELSVQPHLIRYL